MRRFSRILLVLIAVTACAWVGIAAQGGAKAGGATKAPVAPAGPVIVLDTVKGSIEIETYPGDAPKSVAHIVELVQKGFYRGQRVHWATPGVAQMGDPSSRDMSKQDAWGRLYGTPVGVAELSKRPFDTGTVGLAYPKDRTPLAAGSQFFILTLLELLHRSDIFLRHVDDLIKIACHELLGGRVAEETRHRQEQGPRTE